MRLFRPKQAARFLLVVLLATSGPARPGAAQLPGQLPQEIGIEQQLNAQVPLELTFQNEQGQTVSLGELLDGKPVILNLVYYRCPMLCNLAMDGMIRALRLLPYDAGDEFTVLTVSFDPREGPKLAAQAKRTALAHYGRPGAAAHWHFLTGREEQIRALADTVGFRYEFDEQTGQYAHAAGLIVLTPQGRVSRYLYGVEYPARDLRLSLVEASQNKIGSLTDQVLLLCYRYDPLTGKYGLLIQNVLRLAGAATVLALVGSIGTMLLRERRGKPAAAAAAGEAASRANHASGDIPLETGEKTSSRT